MVPKICWFIPVKIRLQRIYKEWKHQIFLTKLQRNLILNAQKCHYLILGNNYEENMFATI